MQRVFSSHYALLRKGSELQRSLAWVGCLHLTVTAGHAGRYKWAPEAGPLPLYRVVLVNCTAIHDSQHDPAALMLSESVAGAWQATVIAALWTGPAVAHLGGKVPEPLEEGIDLCLDGSGHAMPCHQIDILPLVLLSDPAGAADRLKSSCWECLMLDELEGLISAVGLAAADLQACSMPESHPPHFMQ